MKKRNGFTLVELLLVVGLLLIVSAFVLPSFSRQWAAYKVRKEAHRLALTLTEARRQSQRVNHSVFVEWNQREYTVTVFSKNKIFRSYPFDRDTQIESSSNRVEFLKNRYPRRQEIALKGPKTEKVRLVVEPFLNQVRIQ